MNPFVDFGRNSIDSQSTDTPAPGDNPYGFLTEAENALLLPRARTPNLPTPNLSTSRHPDMTDAGQNAPDYMNMDANHSSLESPTRPYTSLYDSREEPRRVDREPFQTFSQYFIEDHESEILVVNESLTVELERLQKEIVMRDEQLMMLKDHQKVELMQARNEQIELHQKILAEREKLEQQRRELTVMLEQISGGLETLEGFERRMETERDRLLAADALRKPKLDFVHIAVAGAKNSGRSSFINSMRGMSSSNTNDHEGVVAPVSVVNFRNSRQRGGYQDPRPNMGHILWYDLPSPVGLAVDPWDYFNSEGMFAYDVIVLILNDSGVVDITDISILQQARYRRYPIPVFLVRMKADIEVRNRMSDLGWERGRSEGGEINDEGFWEMWAMAKYMYGDNARGVVEGALAKYRGLDPEKKVYLVARQELMEVATRFSEANRYSALQSLITFHQEALKPRILDEESLWRDLMRAVNRIWTAKCKEAGKPVPTLPIYTMQAPMIPFSRNMVVLASPNAPIAASESDYELV